VSVSFTRHYDIHGLRLSVEAESAVLGESLETVLGAFAVCANEGGGYQVNLCFGEPPRREAAPLLWRGEWASDVELECYHNDGTRIFLVPDRARLCLDLVRHRCDVVVKPGQERCLRCGCMTYVLCEFLGNDGQHVVHAACLAAETETDKRAVLLAGVCGAGKTTTALALARAGMRILTDDAAFLVQRAAGLRVWGLPRPCKVHRQTVKMMDWLDAVESRPIAGTEESAVDLRHLPSGDPRWELVPGLVLLLEPRNERSHRLQETNNVDALAELTRQNVRTAHGLAINRAGESFQALASLVMNSRVYRLSVGPELGTLHGLLQSLLEA